MYPTMLCPGEYFVTVTDAMGCTVSDSVEVLTIPSVVASFTMVPDSVNPYSFWVFNSSSGPSLYNLWDFGDGVTSTAPAPTHTYYTPGTYTVCLSAVSTVCGADTVCHVVVPDVPASCLALFNIGDDTVSSNPDDHYIYNLSYGSSLTYLWSFGDGTNSTLATPSHIYSGAGPYTLCLTVDNGAGCTQTYCDTLFSADSLNRAGNISFVTYDVAPPSDITTSLASSAKPALKVYPQPASSSLTIELGISRKDLSFEIIDVLGKVVLREDNLAGEIFNLSLDGLASGLYMYRLKGGEVILAADKLIIR
jgi:PKD repeat protein